jgi:hypothetical protein
MDTAPKNEIVIGCWFTGEVNKRWVIHDKIGWNASKNKWQFSNGEDAIIDPMLWTPIVDPSHEDMANAA